MLHAMEQLAKPSSSSGSSSFAGLLATLTSPAKESENLCSIWGGDGLGDDVVTLTYEQALRNHSRYRTGEHRDLNPLASAQEAIAGAAQDTMHDPSGRSDDESPTPTEPRAQTTTDHELRTSSVTIRLSQAECTQLRQRAVETGLTVSAYLRSCVLEADALRAQVKEALAEMKTKAEDESAAAPVRRPWLGWIGRKAGRR